jgi:ribosomal protein S19
MPRRSEWVDYAVYPPDFRTEGICWSFRRVSKARSKAKSLGVGSWIRRFVNIESEIGAPLESKTTRRWMWNGKRFVRIQVEPEMFGAEKLAELLGLVKALAQVRSARSRDDK